MIQKITRYLRKRARNRPIDMNRLHLTIGTNVQHEAVGELNVGLMMFNYRHPAYCDFRFLTGIIWEGRNRPVGGLWGATRGGWLHIEGLWLHESVRGQGWGTRLVQSAEREAISRGCTHAEVDTFSFQAPAFYQKLGYEIFAVLEPIGESDRKYFLKKTLVPADPA